MSEIEKMYKNANIKPEYRYDCNLADTIKPIEVFRLSNCSKGEIKDFCTNKQYYRYCKVYKVNKIFPPFTAEKQLELIKWLASSRNGILISDFGEGGFSISTGFYYCAKNIRNYRNNEDLGIVIAMFINDLWQDLTEGDQEQIRSILKG